MSSRPMIAYFDDNVSNLTLFKEILSSEFDVHTFQDPMTYASVMKQQYSAFLLDVRMPKMDGFSLFRHIKSHPQYNHCPVIFLTSDVSDNSRFEAYGIGAHDFIDRSVKKEELVLRLHNRIGHFKETNFLFTKGSLEINLRSLRAELHGKPIDLTLTEFKILTALLQRSSEVQGREELCQSVWPGVFVQATTLNTHLSNLRSKLSRWEFDIISLKGKGIQMLEKSPEKSRETGL